jgi:PKHD-type hydroxylase
MPSFLPEHCLTLSRALSPDVCNEIIEIGLKQTELHMGQTGNSDKAEENHRTRKSGVGWLDREAKLADGKTIFEHITPLVRECNSDVFKFDLNYHETYQFTIYKAPDEHYEWHCDGHFEAYSADDCKDDPDFEERVGGYRKLSYSVNLTHPDEYEGGHFEWCDPYSKNPLHDPERAVFRAPQSAREQGSIIIFPSFVYHRVTPVNIGRRHSLVGWIAGPTFR